jgi:lipopolysaccharide export system permease protein
VKILDRYILKSFLITFATVFVILFFIFILQTVWLFISELAGKGLDFFLILKFLLFAMPRIIPLVLPLSVVLASIMTFGSFAENYEFAAMKSSGISLGRAMKSLMFFIGILSIASFFFANDVIPYAEFKFVNFRTDIGKKQPALAIAEGQFSDVGSYNIKVEKKSGENGNHLTGVTIHQKAPNGGTSTVIKSKTGELVASDDSNILKLILNDGYYYQDLPPKKYADRFKMEFAKSGFKRYVINMDLSKLNKVDESGDKVTNNNAMLNINELNYTLDSLHKSYKKDIISFADNIYQRTGIVSLSGNIPAPPMRSGYTQNYPIPPPLSSPNDGFRQRPQLHLQHPIPTVKPSVNANEPPKDVQPKAQKELPKDLLSLFANDADKQTIFKIALGNVESTTFSIESSSMEMDEKIKTINSHQLALYDKFVIAYACILMFFIGAPLGAIIRKGGVGLPIVFAILIFITFHFINTFGKKISQSNELPPFLGAWMSSIILTPLAVLLTYRATNDIGLFSMENILDPIQRFFRKIFPPKKQEV